MSRLLSLGLLAASITAASAVANDRHSPIGVWIDESGRGAVEIAECGGKLCGKVVWLQSSKFASRCSLAIIGDVAATGDGKWSGGWIYDPDTKSKFSVEIGPASADKLNVLGYAGSKLFSREMTWTRAPGDLARCDQQPAQIAAVRAPVKQVAAEPDKAASPSVPVTLAAQPEASVRATPASVKPTKTAARSKKPRGGETIKLAELRSYGLQDVTLRKGSGSCSLKISDFGRVAFPC